MLGADALSALGSGPTLPFFVVYLHAARGFGLARAGLALASIAVAGLAGNPLGGWLSDHAGPRNALVTGSIMAAAGSLGVALVREPWHAFAAAAAFGVGVVVCWPACTIRSAWATAPDAFRADRGARGRPARRHRDRST